MTRMDRTVEPHLSATTGYSQLPTAFTLTESRAPVAAPARKSASWTFGWKLTAMILTCLLAASQTEQDTGKA